MFCFCFFQIIIVVINERTCWCLTVLCCCPILKKMYNNDCQFLSKTHEMAIIIWTVLTDLKRKQTRIMNVLELERLMGSRTGCVSDREGLRTLTCCARRVSAETEDLPNTNSRVMILIRTISCPAVIRQVMNMEHRLVQSGHAASSLPRYLSLTCLLSFHAAKP